MTKIVSHQGQRRLTPYSGRVSKRQWAPKERRSRLTTRSEVTHDFLLQNHPGLLGGLMLPPVDIARAAAKFQAFVELERIASEMNCPIAERLIASDVRVDGYQILPAKRSPEVVDKASIVAIVTLAVGQNANFWLAKEREAIILAEATEDESGEAGRRVCGFITKRQGWHIIVRLTCKREALEELKQLPLQLFVDINSAARKAQLDAVTAVIPKPAAPKANTPRSRSRSPSIIWLDDDDMPEKPTTLPTAPAPSTGLNAEQQLAIEEITRFETTDLFMLFGPPSTGKTFTLVKAIVELVQSGGRVLICTPSNKAADVIACGILNEGIQSLYRHVSRTLDPMMVPPQLRSHAGIQTNGQQAFFAADDTTDLDDYDVVVTTLGSTPALRKSMTNARKEFSHIVIDEAGQATEMEVWMPLAFFGAESTRLIVAGDPMQLGPVAPVRLLDDPAYGYKTSILSRLYQNEAFRTDSQNMVQLTKNYRSHESIVNFVSTVFYNNKLEYTRPLGHDSLQNWHRLPNDNFPVFFENTYGNVYTDANGSSYNETEANSVVFYIESLLRSRRVKAHEIGVVSPYTAQTQLIRHLLGPSSEVTVDTVEKFQGSERRVIIMTAVRNGTALGFMEDRQRLNTALSRAQQLLIVIGHGRSLEASPDWFKFIDYCKANNAYVDASDIADSRMSA